MKSWITMAALIALLTSCENMGMKDTHKEKKHETNKSMNNDKREEAPPQNG